VAHRRHTDRAAAVSRRQLHEVGTAHRQRGGRRSGRPLPARRLSPLRRHRVADHRRRRRRMAGGWRVRQRRWLAHRALRARRTRSHRGSALQSGCRRRRPKGGDRTWPDLPGRGLHHGQRRQAPGAGRARRRDWKPVAVGCGLRPARQRPRAVVLVTGRIRRRRRLPRTRVGARRGDRTCALRPGRICVGGGGVIGACLPRRCRLSAPGMGRRSVLGPGHRLGSGHVVRLPPGDVRLGRHPYHCVAARSGPLVHRRPVPHVHWPHLTGRGRR
jgi:hypothetical protein